MLKDIEDEEEDTLYDHTTLLDLRKRKSPGVTWCCSFTKTVCLSLTFFALGLCIAIPGPTLLDLQDRIHTDTTHMALIFSARSFGYLFGSFIGGFLFDHFDKQLLLTMTLMVAALATSIIPWSLTLAVLAVMISLQGISMGVLDTGGNAFCVRIWGNRGAPYIQAMHFAFGVGAFIAPLLSQPFLSDLPIFTFRNNSIVKDLQFNLNPYPYNNPFDQGNHTLKGRSVTLEDNATTTFIVNINSTANPVFLNLSSPMTHEESSTHGHTTKLTQVPVIQSPSSPKKPSFTDTTYRDKGIADGKQLKDVKKLTSKHLKEKVETPKHEKKKHKDVPKNISLNNFTKDNSTIEIPPTSSPNSTTGKVSLPTNATKPPTESVINSTMTLISALPTTKHSALTNSSATSIANLSTENPTAVLTTKTPTHKTTTIKSTTEKSTTVLTTRTPITLRPSTIKPTTPKLTTIKSTTTKPTTSEPTTTKPTTPTTTTKPSTKLITSTSSQPPTPKTTPKPQTTKKPSVRPHTTQKSSKNTQNTEYPSGGQNVTVTLSNHSDIIVTTVLPKKPPTEETDDVFNTAVTAVVNMSRVQFAYLIIGCLLLLNALLFCILYCYDRHRSEISSYDNDESRSETFGNPCCRYSVLFLMFLFFMAYIGMETTFGGLLMTFTVSFKNWSKDKGAIVTAIFWGSLAAGRGFSIFIANCFRPTCMLSVDLGLVILGSLMLSFGIYYYESVLWIGTLTLGFGMSSMFPTAVSWMEQNYKLTGKSTAVLVMGSAIGQMVIPVTTGYFYEYYQKMSLMYMCLALSMIMTVFFILMHFMTSRSENTPFNPENDGFSKIGDEEHLEMEDVSYGTTTSAKRRFMPAFSDTEYNQLLQDEEDVDLLG